MILGTVAARLRAIDDHDLLALKNFWASEVKALEVVEQIHGADACNSDLGRALTKLDEYQGEINRRKGAK